MKLRIPPGTVPIVLALATFSVVRTQPSRESQASPAAPPRTDFADHVEAVGFVEASSENISLGSHLPGVVETVFVTVGQDVKRGDALVKLDTRALESALAERRSDLATRQAEVKVAEARARKARAVLAEVQRRLGFAESIYENCVTSTQDMTERHSALAIAEADVQAAEAGVTAAEAAVGSSQSAIRSVETDLCRSVVTAPVDGRILRLGMHPGEFTPSGAAAQGWLVLGRVTPLHVRVDIDEHAAWRIAPGAAAFAQVRGNPGISSPLQFVRFEPCVVPNQSLTGSATGCADTRFIQAIYRVEREHLPLFVGQQVDVVIHAASPAAAIARR